MSVQQVWSGLNSNQWNPFYANIENQGGNETGVLTTVTGQEQTNIEYPLEIPSGSKKRVMFLMGGYNDGKVYLHLGSGTKEATIRSSYGNEQTRVGLISDNPSDLIFLKGQPTTGTDAGNNAIGVGGCIPDDAPDRFMGYDCLDSLVLADGTERLRDDQIDAIKRYVRSGGVLVFVGGAASSASGDPRWRDILPIENSNVVTRNGLTERIGTMISDARAIEIPKGIAYTRSYGMGLVSLMSVNPFESPVRESEDRRSMVSKVLQRNHHQQIQQLLFAQIGQNNEDYYGGYSAMPVAGTIVAPPASPGSPALARIKGAPTTPAQDPFNIKPPSVESIMWILIGYTIIVVPINFLVLRKMNRLELAWVTTPIISIIFSAVLLNSTIGLYKASATTRTMSVAIVEPRAQDSLIFGKSEMFFPRAQSYDLQLQGVETILREGRYGRSGASGITLSDSGREVQAPNVRTGNLAFKDLSFAQSSEELSGLKIILEKVNGKRVMRIRNQSHANLAGITVYGPGTETILKDNVAIGKSLDVAVDNIANSKPGKSQDQNALTWRSIAATMPNHLIVFCHVDQMRVGPKYGEGHPASRYAVVGAPQWGGQL